MPRGQKPQPIKDVWAADNFVKQEGIDPHLIGHTGYIRGARTIFGWQTQIHFLPDAHPGRRRC